MFGNRHVRAYLDSLSKADLADYVVDLLRAGHGADLDDVELLVVIRDTVGPTLMVRGKPKGDMADRRSVPDDVKKKFLAAAEASRAVADALIRA